MKNALKSGLWTALFTFLGLFIPTLLSWTQKIAEWASSSGHTPLPGISTLGYAAVSAAMAAITGLIAFAWRAAQTTKYWPGQPPKFVGSE